MSDGDGQAQPIRPGDVYSPTAANPEARRERDKVLDEQGDGAHRQQHKDGALHVTETDLPDGRRVVTATAAGQVMSQFTVPVAGSSVAEATDAVTMGEALQAVALTAAGLRPVDLADAAVIQVAEMRATGLAGVVPGGVAAAAQQAAEANMKAGDEGEKVLLKDVVGHAAKVLPANKVVTREDAEKVAAAAERNAAKGGEGGAKGVVDAVTAAAEMNKGRMV